MQQNGFFIAKLTVRSTCFGHHYTHHQELKSYTGGCCLWYLSLNPPFQLAIDHPSYTYKTETVEKHPANRTHNPQLAHASIRHFHTHTTIGHPAV